jgi:hypothetical protein
MNQEGGDRPDRGMEAAWSGVGMEEGVPPLGQMLATPDPGADAGVEGDYREDQTKNFQQHAAAGLH